MKQRKPSTFRTARGTYARMAAALRKLRGELQQKLVAEAAGLSTVAVSSYETGRTIPSTEALRCLCVAMGCEGKLQELLWTREDELKVAIATGVRTYDVRTEQLKPGQRVTPRPEPRRADPTPAPRRRGPGFPNVEAARRAGVLGGLAAARRAAAVGAPAARCCRTCGEPRKGHPAIGCPKNGTAKPPKRRKTDAPAAARTARPAAARSVGPVALARGEATAARGMDDARGAAVPAASAGHPAVAAVERDLPGAAPGLTLAEKRAAIAAAALKRAAQRGAA